MAKNHRLPVKMIKTEYNTYAVDTPEDLIKVEKIMKSKKL